MNYLHGVSASRLPPANSLDGLVWNDSGRRVRDTVWSRVWGRIWHRIASRTKKVRWNIGV